MTPLVLGAGTALDWLIGDPPRPTHPVVVMGRTTRFLEGLLWREGSRVGQRMRGLGVTLLVVGGTLLLSALLLRVLGAGWLGDLVALWLFGTTLAARSLNDHALAVEKSLQAGDLSKAREAVGRIVGRDTQELPPREVARAAVESVAENTGDGVLSPLFFAALGAALEPWGLSPLAAAAVFALGYKAVNTLDSMLGYRSPRYLHFGWASARLDDVANFLPARLAPIMVALAALLVGGSPAGALRTAVRDGRNHPSPNSGLLEAAYAGALGFELGGPTVYAGVRHERKTIGVARFPLDCEAIWKSRRLLFWTSLLGTALACLAVWAVRR